MLAHRDELIMGGIALLSLYSNVCVYLILAKGVYLIFMLGIVTLRDSFIGLNFDQSHV